MGLVSLFLCYKEEKNMEKHSKIFVAGGNGLVGGAIVRELVRLGYDNILISYHSKIPKEIQGVTPFQLDLTDQKQVFDFFKNQAPDFVFLAAAKVGGIMANNTRPADFITTNLLIQNNIIQAAWGNRVRRLLFLGSSCIYPKSCPQPMKEEHLLTGPLEPTNRPYALAKIAGIEMCWDFNRQYGTKYIAAMPTNLYGIGDNYDLQGSHVLPAVIRKIHLAKMINQSNISAIEADESKYGRITEEIKNDLGIITVQGKDHDKTRGNSQGVKKVAQKQKTHKIAIKGSPKVRFWGSGTPHREFLYVDDLARACVFLLNLSESKYNSLLKTDEPPLINIGYGKDITIKDLVQMVQEVVGFQGEIFWDSDKPDGTAKKLLDISQMRKLGWSPKINLKKGIALAYNDYFKQDKCQSLN